MKKHTAALEDPMNPDDVKVIVAGLQAFNASQANGDVPSYLVVALRDDGGALVGGLLGATYLGWLHVQALWVPEPLRGQGHGKALLALAEEEAIRRGCPRVFLETLSFQAPDFYEKLGYVVASRIAGFPIGGTRFAFTKQLAAADGQATTLTEMSGSPSM